MRLSEWSIGLLMSFGKAIGNISSFVFESRDRVLFGLNIYFMEVSCLGIFLIIFVA